jgi:hypothetical protein
MTHKLNQEYMEAMAAHRADFVAMNPNRCKAPRTAERLWREQLTNAWLNDWREQWGILRSIRNTIGIQEAFAQFTTYRKSQG